MVYTEQEQVMELHGVEAVLVPTLKWIMLAVMVGGGIAVFREMIPMARGKTPNSAARSEEQD
jgi:hypothetical protein